MLMLLSPAKSLDLTSPLPTRTHTMPALLEEATALVDVMRGKSPEELAELMGISAELAELNARRFAEFTTPFTLRNARQAVFMFDGDVYRGMAPGRFDARDLTEAQKTVRILSGLYGLLRPLDLIQPYRLEMGTRLATARGDSLYRWWGSTIADRVLADLAASPGPDVVVNLASDEYARAVGLGAGDTARLDARVVTPRFEDETPSGEFKVVGFHAKRARGLMSSWIVRGRLRSVRGLREFDQDGYQYAPELSTADGPVFRRPRRR